jgi:FkbM family methyltransferase
METFINYIKIFIIIIFIFSIYYILLIYEINTEINNLKTEIKNVVLNNNHKPISNIINKNIYSIIGSHLSKQIDFCDNFYNHYNSLIENKIIIVNFTLKNISFPMYIYKKDDYLSKLILKNGYSDKKEFFNILDALKYYSLKKDIKNNKDIFILDIGGNIGIYPMFLGLFGYTIISFEPSPINYYILNKNFCNTRKSNIIIINTALSNKESNCKYYFQNNNIGNGMLLCDNFKDFKVRNNFDYFCNVTLLKLNNFYSFFQNENIALIKIDIEGSEGNALEGGIDFIEKYHVPFIFMEFTPMYLKEHNTNPIKLLQLFTDNGYKISLKGFLSKEFISIDYIMKHIKVQINLYFIYMN